MKNQLENPIKKSKAASAVLQLMDEDYSYEQSLKMVLSSYTGSELAIELRKRLLEKELNIFLG